MLPDWAFSTSSLSVSTLTLALALALALALVLVLILLLPSLLTESLTLIGRDITSSVSACLAAVSFLPKVSRLLGAGRLVASNPTSSPIGGVLSSNLATGASNASSNA